jgi:hypothetical protein
MLGKVPAALLALLLAAGFAWAQQEVTPPGLPGDTAATGETADEALVMEEVIEVGSDPSVTSALIGDGMVAPGSIVVSDLPNDAGDALVVSFEPGTEAGNENFMGYAIYRRNAGEVELAKVGLMTPDEGTIFTDGYDPDYPVEPGVQYEYQVAALYILLGAFCSSA